MGQKNSVGQPKSSGGSPNHVVNNTSTNVTPVGENRQHQDLEADSHQYLDYPFLCDETTLNYLSGSKTMFIMRGLPGSGKSCIAHAIHTTYKNSVICSEDDYFICNEILLASLQPSHFQLARPCSKLVGQSINLITPNWPDPVPSLLASLSTLSLSTGQTLIPSLLTSLSTLSLPTGPALFQACWPVYQPSHSQLARPCSKLVDRFINPLTPNWPDPVQRLLASLSTLSLPTGQTLFQACWPVYQPSHSQLARPCSKLVGQFINPLTPSQLARPCSKLVGSAPDQYEFNQDKLHEAHISCKDKAKKACEDNINVVIIDNTNIRQWEMEYYFDLAKETCYCVVLVEPHTPWKFSPELLVGKNKRNVGVELLAAKIAQWEVVVPLYFGWYLNEADSHILSLVGLAHLEECLQVPAFLEDFKDFSKLTDISKLLRYYTLPKSCPGGMLHCTAKFCLGGKVPGSLEYASKEEVVDSCGRSYPLLIVGLLMTPRTFGARVKLEKEQLTLWGGENESAKKPRPQNVNIHGSSYKDIQNNPGEKIVKKDSFIYCTASLKDIQNNPGEKIVKKDSFIYCTASLASSSQFEPSFHPTSGTGSKAHVTLGCAEGVEAVTTGLDLEEIVACESEPDIGGSCLTYTLRRGWLRNYGESRWMLYFKQQLTVGTLFTGYYPLS
uniref:2',3'-cyclic-nucleotide 3'-phosphodiesterase n=1 Tax=Timema californicum TaxID=61474 RepID=A0A7R9P5G1_TIMCA|nr:unnamed protein product [Timema californicum]